MLSRNKQLGDLFKKAVILSHGEGFSSALNEFKKAEEMNKQVVLVYQEFFTLLHKE